MRRLTSEEMNIAAGGGTPGLICSQTDSSTSVSGNTTTTHASQICQTSSGLTIITTTDTIKVTGEVGITGKIKELVGIEIKGGYEKTTTDTTVCKSNGECTTTTRETTTGQKSGDIGDGLNSEGFADFGSQAWGDDADWDDGGAWAGGDSDAMGSGGKADNIFGNEYEIEMC